MVAHSGSSRNFRWYHRIENLFTLKKHHTSIHSRVPPLRTRGAQRRGKSLKVDLESESDLGHAKNKEKHVFILLELAEERGLRGWEFCTICPFFANFSTFTKIPQVPSFQAHSPVKIVFRQNPENARKSQNTPSKNPYQNETQFPLSSLKNANTQK